MRAAHVHRLQLAAHHQVHDLVDRDLLGAEHAHVLAVPQDRDTVGHPRDFVHAMGDVDDADAAGAECR